MTIAAGLIQLLLILLPVVLAAWARSNSQMARLNKLNEEADKAIAVSDVDSVNVMLDNALQQLQNKDNGVKQ